ncbi:MAG: polysaccharide biosynthesis/export family protein [Akkermansia sp.]|nr:polysaccharide biosynthesis/export family protein [Akkermansia sp.]MBQ7023361.1 polysaccharide biosynthesis/export family protein [Akkermansia sp.]
MKELITKAFRWALAGMLLVVPALAQSDEGLDAEPRARRGGDVILAFRNIPAEDKANVDGKYTVSNEDGTINLPYLSSRVKVDGKTARQLEDMLRQLYIEQQIYARPIVTAQVGNAQEIEEHMRRRIDVTGYVNSKKSVPYRPGITLLQALLECGDISMHGSRRIQVTRKGVIRTYDYFSVKDRSLKLRPDDQIYVLKRGPFESRPDKLLP